MDCPASPCSHSVLPFGFLKKPLPSTIAHKAFNTAFQSLGGVRMLPGPQDGNTSPHRDRHGAFRFCVVVPDAVRRSLAENDVAKNLLCVLRFSELFRRSRLAVEDALMITA